MYVNFLENIQVSLLELQRLLGGCDSAASFYKWYTATFLDSMSIFEILALLFHKGGNVRLEMVWMLGSRTTNCH